MKLRTIPWILLAAALLAASLSGCGKKVPEKRTASYFDYFDTVITVIGFEDDETKFSEVCSFIESEFARYDELYDGYDDSSSAHNLYYINRHAGEAPVTVDPDVIGLLKFGKETWELTGGFTNIAFGAVLSIWHEHREAASSDPASASVPSMEELKEAALHCDIRDLVLDEEASTVYYSDPLLRLDVGAIAKGYAIERITGELIDMGLTGYAINAGGNVRTVGPRGDGADWNVAIQNPDLLSEKNYVETLGLTDRALTTSGSYQRYFYVGETKYHHIIHPDTLFPVNTFMSVSVVNPDAGVGDALSTALFNMTLEEGIALIDSLPDTEALWIYGDGSAVYSAGWPNKEIGKPVSAKDTGL